MEPNTTTIASGLKRLEPASRKLQKEQAGSLKGLRF